MPIAERPKRLAPVVRSGAALEQEPVSPELVLVDPELARRERARLSEKAYLAERVDVAALRRAVESSIDSPETAPPTALRGTIAHHLRTRLLPAALMCSLLANGFLAAHLVARTDATGSKARVAVAVRTVTATETLSGQATNTAPSRVVRSTTHQTSSRAPRRLEVTKASVERKLVSLILAAPARKLPRALIDPKTGLVKNNVQVVCHRAKGRSFLCTVRLSTQRAKQAFFVRYRPRREGKGVFTWYGNPPG